MISKEALSALIAELTLEAKAARTKASMSALSGSPSDELPPHYAFGYAYGLEEAAKKLSALLEEHNE